MESRLRPFGLMFERSLNGLIKGLRARKDPDSLAKYIKRVIAECREEVRSPDLDVKAMAVLKLAYLEMYGYDMTWAGFHVLEVMSSPKFQQKRVGYLAAMQSFREDPELLMLATNLLKTDLASPNQERVGIALSGLAAIVTPLLAADVCDDIVKMLNHSKAYVRKKAVLTMYKIVLQYPEAISVMMPRLRDKLDDEDMSVVSATVNVICELSYQSTVSRSYLELAPPLFELLTSTQNNWMHIKILKLFASFSLQEPRLKPKLSSHIVHVIETTEATSLLYEAVSALLKGGMIEDDDYDRARLCVNKLRGLMDTMDPNLQYVSLTALSQLARINPDFLSGEHEMVLKCIDDDDMSLRRKVLEMLAAIVTEDNLVDIVTQLVDQLRQPDMLTVSPEYKAMLVQTVVGLCSANNYDRLPNFEWYTETLVELALLSFPQVPTASAIVGAQLQNVALRVKSVRAVVVNACLNLSLNSQLVSKQPQLLDYTLWTIGEYISDYLSSAQTGPSILESLEKLPPRIISVPAIGKVFTRYVGLVSNWSESTAATVGQAVESIVEYLQRLASSAEFEIQERAVQFLELFRLAAEAVAAHPADSDGPPALLTVAFPSLFYGLEITPVAASTQARIALPDTLDLSQPVELPDVSFSESDDDEIEWPVEPEEEPVEDPEPPRRDPRNDPFYIPKSTDEYSDESRGTSASYGASRGASRGPSQNVSRSASRSGSHAPSARASPTHSREASTDAEPIRRKKVQKVKVEVAQDELVDGAAPEEAPASRATRANGKQPLFKQTSRLGRLTPSLDEPAASTGDEVVVKHKKVKSKKSKSDKSKSDKPKSEKSEKSKKKKKELAPEE